MNRLKAIISTKNKSSIVIYGSKDDDRGQVNEVDTDYDKKIVESKEGSC